MKKKIFDEYVDAICEHFDIERGDLFHKSKDKVLSDARHLLYYICWIRPMSVSYIQRFMADSGYKTPHSSIVYGYKKIEQLVDEDPDYHNIVNKIA